jgi:hypothetical protein
MSPRSVDGSIYTPPMALTITQLHSRPNENDFTYGSAVEGHSDSRRRLMNVSHALHHIDLYLGARGGIHPELYAAHRGRIFLELPKGIFQPSFSPSAGNERNIVQILDLKGTPKASQSDLFDSFLTITSTKSELQSTSFLSSLDMDPSPSSHLTALNIASPGSGRLALPVPSAAESASGPSTGDSATTGSKGDQKREKFSDFKRFVSFGLRRDSAPPPS